MADILELRRDASGVGYFLNGVPVEPGSYLQLQVYCGRWISGVFEWEGQVGAHPKLRVGIGSDLPPERTTFVIQPHLLVRWPLVAQAPRSPVDRPQIDRATTAAQQIDARARF